MIDKYEALDNTTKSSLEEFFENFNLLDGEYSEGVSLGEVLDTTVNTEDM